MSGGRVSIPNNVRKTIHNIKEITGNHSEDEIYAMLKDCSMDPNETAQKLLSLDPFHEVKRKRDRKKENLNKESTEPRWKPGMQGRGNRGGRSNYSSRRISTDGIAHLPVRNDEKKSEVVPAVEPIPTAAGSVRGPLISRTSATSAPKALAPSPGSIKREVGSQQTPVDQIHESESTAFGSKDVPFSISRPSSKYNNRQQQPAIGPQKVGPSMEWKPKPTNPVTAHGTGSTESQVPAVQVESQTPNPPASSNLDSKEAIHTLEKKLEQSHISDDQHVIIPNHLHVPEAEKLGFCFGSFDASFSFNATSSMGLGPRPVSDISSEASEVADESVDEQPRNQSNVLVSADDEDHPDRPSSSSNNIPENLSTEGDTSSNAGPDHHESKQETSAPTASQQYPILHTSPNLSFGFIPPMIGTHLTSFETNESHSRDGSQVPNFVVQPPFDPATYYAQFYRSGADVDGRVSPFHSTGVPNKFNGNIPPVIAPQASHSSQEVGNSLTLSGAGATPITATQTGGFMQTSIPVTQQPLPVFRQPTGVHLPHYPPNYIPYGPFFSPFYVPPPTIHQFLSNNTFPQPPQAGGMYPVPQAASPKYPLPQYKASSNAPVNIGMPGGYGPYGLNPAGYNSGSAGTGGNSASDEDLSGSQFKENNAYITGQQSEGSGVWMAAPGRDMANSFYNIPQGGQVSYTPAQASHATFANIYHHHHPAQPVTTTAVHPLLQQSQTRAGPGADMVGPTSQINWPNNY